MHAQQIIMISRQNRDIGVLPMELPTLIFNREVKFIGGLDTIFFLTFVSGCQGHGVKQGDLRLDWCGS